jgi:hypothetical protein
VGLPHSFIHNLKHTRLNHNKDKRPEIEEPTTPSIVFSSEDF